ncbi:Ig-like domain-containing protein [Colwellia sp. MSW7]|uniref:Ig-like domain-containing protein n=1 Tax=Colwellia maritima TaxID=2912588 RepID=A0ABS9X8L7_9GAMM|nr:Ig-like domain-containing protein [Colwellia maritima]
MSGVTLSSEGEQLITGKQITLTPMLTPSFATDTSVTWSSSNEAIAKVDSLWYRHRDFRPVMQLLQPQLMMVALLQQQ